MNILIGLPCYSGLLHLDCLNSILDFNRVKLPITVMGLGNESLITRGRNTIISYFYNMKQFSHLFFLDADIGISGIDVIKLLSHNKDVIGAPVALKGYDAQGNPVFNTGKILKNVGSGLVKVDKVGTAVLILSRRAVNSLVEHAKENNDIYFSNPNSRGNVKQMEMYDIFKTLTINSEYLSEDFFVCRTLQELGFSIYVDVGIKTTHTGSFTFGGK